MFPISILRHHKIAVLWLVPCQLVLQLRGCVVSTKQVLCETCGRGSMVCRNCCVVFGGQAICLVPKICSVRGQLVELVGKILFSPVCGQLF